MDRGYRALLDSLRKQYPYGIPRVVQSEEVGCGNEQHVPAEARASRLISFVSENRETYSGVLLETLHAAVMKGMKLELENVEFVTLQDAVQGKYVLYLGCRPKGVLTENSLVTQSIEDVVRSPKSKRAFWDDLQNILRRIHAGS